MSSSYFLSIITVCYNDLENLKKTRQSVLSQECKNFEHIIIDGASTDGSVDYLKELKDEPNTTIISEPDRGIYDAMNKWSRVSKGQYIWFLNAGDIIHQENVTKRLQDSVDNLDEAPNVLYGIARCIHEEFSFLHGGQIDHKDFFVRMPCCHQAMIYKSECLANHKYSRYYRIISDLILTYQLYEKYNGFKYEDVVMVDYDMSGLSSRFHLVEFLEKLSVVPYLYKDKWKYAYFKLLIELLKKIVVRFSKIIKIYRLLKLFQARKK